MRADLTSDPGPALHGGATRPRAGAIGAMPGLQRVRGWLVWLALAYLAFVVYGSLVPLEYRAVPWQEALARFRDMPHLDLGIGSRADWVANILLFIPLAFVWLALFWSAGPPARQWAWGIPLTLLVLAGCLGLSLAVEFTQIFFPPRTVSRNDVLAEGLGAGIGILAWWLAGGMAIGWLARWRSSHGSADAARQLFWSYLLLLSGYNLLPLDLTISPVEIFHKWREGKLLLVPFLSLASDPAQLLYDLAIDTLIWAPVTLFWLLRGDKPAAAAWRDTVLLAVLLELLQLFVYSRVTDSTDLFTAAAGAGLGVVAVRIAKLDRGVQPPTAFALGPWPWALAAAGWVLLLPVIFWYPYDFSLDRTSVQARLAELDASLFSTYYYGTEFRAITEVFHKLGFFAPLGGLLAMAAARAPYLHRFWYAWSAPLLGLLTAVGIEAGQLLLPAKYPNLTDVLLEVFGVGLGFIVVRWAQRRLGGRRPVAARTPTVRARRRHA